MNEALLQSPSPLVKPAMQGRERRERQVTDYLLWAIEARAPVDVYAQIRGGHFGSHFWYKVFFLTPHGIWRSDTGGEGIERKRFALQIIQRQELTRVSLDALMQNWQRYGVWEISRPIGAALLRQWEAREARRSMAQAGRHADPMRGSARWN